MAYQLELPDNLSDVHNVFHVSQLKKYLRVPEEQLPMEELSVQGDLTYTEYPIKILDTLTRVTRNKVIKICKVHIGWVPANPMGTGFGKISNL
jgi:hypothetical protein